jgi:hypothetical protein
VHSQRTILGKATEINENPLIYGTFAEIGAGQEVARHFFHAGKASQTVAKTISAYDMVYSDEIYGKEANGRYVCESRLLKMLEKEYSLLDRRLQKTRGDKTTFFAFANTVATGDQSKRQPHGWMGIRFQLKPNGPVNDIAVHVRMMDRYRLMQQEALGVMGVNLVYGAFKNFKNISDFIDCLVDTLKEGQVVIDYLRVSGPDLEHLNNHLLNLELVRRGLAEAVLFSPEKSIVSVSDTIYGRPVIVERGSFRPVTNSHLDLLNKGGEYFNTAFPKSKNPLMLFEVTMHDSKQFDESDFLSRVRALSSTGHHVLVSHFSRFFSLKRYLRQYTKEPIAMIIGANLLEKIFAEEFYKDLEGGILEGLGKLLDSSTRIFVYPNKTADSCMTTKTFFPVKNLLPIYKYFIDQKWIVDMADCEEIAEFVNSNRVVELIKKGDKKWLSLVPATVAELIKKENLFEFDQRAARSSKN